MNPRAQVIFQVISMTPLSHEHRVMRKLENRCSKTVKHFLFRLGTIYREKMMHETFVYICDPKDVSVLVRNEGKAPIRPHLDAIVEARNQEGLAVGITSHQGQFLANKLLHKYPRNSP